MCQRRITRPIVLLEGDRRLTWPHFRFGGMALLGSPTRGPRGRLSSGRRPSSRRVGALRCYVTVVGGWRLSGERKWRTTKRTSGGRLSSCAFVEFRRITSRTTSRLSPLEINYRRRVNSRNFPFIGNGGLLRVGSRLQHAPLPYDDEKFPIILPGRCLIVRRLVELAHEDTLHGGPQLMRAHLGRMFWILHGPRIVHAVYQNCVRCARFRAAALEQLMGPLPAVRVTPGRPFQARIGLCRTTACPVFQGDARPHLPKATSPSSSAWWSERFTWRWSRT
ncbi:unnamed protein product [Trichogramma brassicae]|uniref:Integrase zinc-binding domain-containing protein n=1 Tax=Trichogramma brassicae TaxID=86971 RepID=A0A6H5J9C1_9HYME|nr:unnamed protein product [Trichogramma brassicae]